MKLGTPPSENSNEEEEEEYLMSMSLRMVKSQWSLFSTMRQNKASVGPNKNLTVVHKDETVPSATPQGYCLPRTLLLFTSMMVLLPTTASGSLSCRNGRHDRAHTNTPSFAACR